MKPRRHFDVESVGPFKPVQKRIPPIQLDEIVYIDNKEHPLYLEQGVIVRKKHIHYRVKFTSTLPNINGKCLWIPEHWVKAVPKDLIKK